MKAIHLMASGNTGGIEVLMRDFSKYSKHENVFIFVWDKGKIAEEIEKNGYKIYYLHAKKAEMGKTVFQICRICIREKADVLVSHHSAPLFYVCSVLLKAIHSNIKTCIYAHADAVYICSDRSRLVHLAKKWINRVAFRLCDCPIAISNDVKNSLIRYLGVPSDKITLIYNGTDTSRFMPKIQMGFHTPVRLLYIGRLVREKGVQTTLAALHDLPENLQWTFAVAGDGDYKTELENQTEAFGLTKQVSFLGNCENVPELLQKYDVFIHMPICDEGFGITIIEAMASGLLCICAAKGGIPEIITHEKDGLLVHSKEELLQVLTHLLAAPDKAEIFKLRENAVNRAKDFDIKRFSEELDSVIGEVKYAGI